MFGFDYYRKGVDIVLDAFDKLTDKYNNIQLGIVFAANKESGLANIKNRFGEIPSWLTVLPPSENISEYYAESRAFISASREEGFCYAIAEAAYCCCQSIISNIPGHRTDIPMIKVFENGNALIRSPAVISPFATPARIPPPFSTAMTGRSVSSPPAVSINVSPASRNASATRSP